MGSPGLRATEASGSTNTGNSNQSIVIPTSGSGGNVAAGDVARLAVQWSSSTGTLTTPSGWSLRSGPDQQSNACWIFTRTLQAGDIGATVPLAFAGGAALAAIQMSIYHDVVEAGLLLQMVKDSASDASTTLPTLSSVPAGALIDAVVCHRFGSSQTPDFDFSTSPYSQGTKARWGTSFTTGSPNNSTESGYRVAPSAGSYGGETLTLDTSSGGAAASVGVNYLMAFASATPQPPVVSYTKQNLVRIDGDATNGGVLTLVQASGPTSGVSISGPDPSGIFEVALPDTLSADIVLTLTGTNDGGTDTESITIPATSGGARGRKVRVGGVYV